jgi:hypothetical protein
MIKKVLIVGLLVASLLAVSTISVTAADEKITRVDPPDDVMDYTASEDDIVYTDEKPNIDIRYITYSKTGTQATLSLEVKGKIENRGDIEDSESLDFVYYEIVLYTNDSYDILYINKTATLNGDTSGITYEMENDKNITFTFDLSGADETYSGLEVTTLDILLMKMYGDEFSDVPEEIIVDAHGPYTAKVGKPVEFTGSVQGGSEPYTWEWDFNGDLQVDSYEQNPTYTYNEEDEFNVILTVTDGTGYQGVDTTTVNVAASGSNNDNNKNSGSSGFLVFIALIAIVVIAVVVVVVVIIRRR